MKNIDKLAEERIKRMKEDGLIKELTELNALSLEEFSRETYSEFALNDLLLVSL